jgi:eukaryotic-like serine/threonine-protein kinase
VIEPFPDRFANPELIGEGGMGSVFRVEDPRLGRQVAVKVLRQAPSEQPKNTERFRFEARTTGCLEHPSIPPVYEYGETAEGLPYFALKLLDGETLRSVIERLRQGDVQTHKTYDFANRIRIAIKLCEALDFAHSQTMLHRDIKPENIMLGPFGEVWLVDWGLAGPPNEEQQNEQPSQERLTEEPTMMGTLQYAAPEQLACHYSQATDQYSLGAVFYELFTLEPAHPGENRMEILTAVLNETPKPAERITHRSQGRVPREISVLLARMIAKKPEERFDSLSSVRQELKVIEGGDIHAICPHTFAKKSLYRVGKTLDNHNYWLMPLLILWLLYPLYALVYWISGYLFG